MISMSGTRRQEDGDVLTDVRSKQKLQRPKLYKVLLHNDDYSTMEFVVAILRSIFRLSEQDATTIMLHIHQRGVGIAGVFTFEVAETKVDEVTRAAEEAEYPLLCTMEPEEGSED